MRHCWSATHFIYFHSSQHPSFTTVALNCWNMINATHARTKCNDYHMTEPTHVFRCPCWVNASLHVQMSRVKRIHLSVQTHSSLLARIWNHFWKSGSLFFQWQIIPAWESYLWVWVDVLEVGLVLHRSLRNCPLPRNAGGVRYCGAVGGARNATARYGNPIFLLAVRYWWGWGPLRGGLGMQSYWLLVLKGYQPALLEH